MKKILLFLVLVFISLPSLAKNLIHPLDFKGSEREKEIVISFIEKNVHEIYCENELLSSWCTNSLLRMMEEEELESFKKLTKAKEGSILNNVMQTYCQDFMADDWCRYSMILMMYEQEVKAAGEKLSW